MQSITPFTLQRTHPCPAALLLTRLVPFLTVEGSLPLASGIWRMGCVSPQQPEEFVMFGKTILPWQKKRYLQNSPQVLWLQLMRPVMILRDGFTEMQLCCFILIMPGLFAPPSIQPCKETSLAGDIQQNWQSRKAILYSTYYLIVNKQ